MRVGVRGVVLEPRTGTCSQHSSCCSSPLCRGDGEQIRWGIIDGTLSLSFPPTRVAIQEDRPFNSILILSDGHQQGHEQRLQGSKPRRRTQREYGAGLGLQLTVYLFVDMSRINSHSSTRNRMDGEILHRRTISEYPTYMYVPASEIHPTLLTMLCSGVRVVTVPFLCFFISATPFYRNHDSRYRTE